MIDLGKILMSMKDVENKWCVLEEIKNELKSDRLILTGSLVLYELGLIDKSVDLDIILVNPSKKTIDKIEDELGGDDYRYPYADIKTIWRGGIKVDIFVKDSYPFKTFQLNGYDCTLPSHIISEKRSYRRRKDYFQLWEISNKIWNPEDIKEFNN